jgi:conjugative transfer pilus assembly protein TraH
MFNSLGSIGNYTAPGAFRGQTFNTYTGGSLFMRAPNKVYQLAAIQFPSAKAGCGGIDVFGGSFSHISAAEFKNMLRNITAALPGIAFQLALESVSPLLGGLTKWAKGLETWINNARINSCETAKAIVSTAAEAAGYSSQEACADLAIETGLESDRDAARRRCATDRTSILATARTSGDANVRNKAPFVGNLTWKALQRTGTSLDDAERELIMSIVGTVIFHAEEDARDPEPIAPTITSISQLLYGQAAGAGTDVTQHLLRCNDYTNCDVVTLNTGLHAHAVHGPGGDHDALDRRQDRHARRHPQQLGRSRLRQPDHRAGLQDAVDRRDHPGSGLSDSLIGQYRDVIAADYAYVFLERNLRVGMAALDKDYTLQQTQRDLANQVVSARRPCCCSCRRRRTCCTRRSARSGPCPATWSSLERQLRSSMPQHVMDMLGQQAAFLSR